MAVSKKKLEIALSALSDFETPKLSLEQYATPWKTAAHIISLINDDYPLEGKIVLDLGCGPGVLGLGCLAAGAAMLYCVEIDSSAIETLGHNLGLSESSELVEVVQCDVRDLCLAPIAVG